MPSHNALGPTEAGGEVGLFEKEGGGWDPKVCLPKWAQTSFPLTN